MPSRFTPDAFSDVLLTKLAVTLNKLFEEFLFFSLQDFITSIFFFVTKVKIFFVERRLGAGRSTNDLFPSLCGESSPANVILNPVSTMLDLSFIFCTLLIIFPSSIFDFNMLSTIDDKVLFVFFSMMFSLFSL